MADRSSTVSSRAVMDSGRDSFDPATIPGGQAVWTAAAFNLLTRLVTFSAIALSARRHHLSISRAVTRWDGAFYLQIAAQGYPAHVPPDGHRTVLSSAAFFPLFPLVTKPLTALGLQFWVAALIVVTICSSVAALLITMVVRRYTSERVALLTACCFSVYPLSGILSMAYSEALMVMLVAGCLLALLCHRWAIAGVLALLAGATRPTGAVLILSCLVASYAAVREQREWRSLVSVALAPLGFLASWAWIGSSAGRWDAWFAAEREGWSAHFDGGRQTLMTAFHATASPMHHGAALLGTTAVLAALTLVVLAAARRPPLPVLIYLVGVFVLVTGTSTSTHATLPRFMLVAFPMLVPIAVFLADRRWRLRVVLLALAGAMSACLGAYFAVYSTISP